MLLIIIASSCTSEYCMGTCQYEELLNGLTISQGRCHRSKPYTTLYRMVCINIHSDVVSIPPLGCHWSVSPQTLQDEVQHQECLQDISLACHHSLDHWNRTSNYTTKWHSTAPGLGGRVGGIRSGNVISLPATKTLQYFFHHLSKIKICEYTFTPNSLMHHSNWHPSVS